MSRVARKQQEARRRLIDAGAELIAAKGEAGLRLREISDRADVGFGSFYSHFGSKEELVDAVVADRVRSLTSSIAARANATSDPAETVAVAHRLFLRLGAHDKAMAWLIVRLDRGESLLREVTRPILGAVLERGLREGRFAEIDVEVMVSFVVGATISVLRRILTGELPETADVESARALLRACGLADHEATRLSTGPAPVLDATAQGAADVRR